MHSRLAERYAKSLWTVGVEQNIIDKLYDDMLCLQTLCKQNRDFIDVLKSPVVKAYTKEKIIHALLEKKIQPITFSFISLLLKKNREYDLFDIVNAWITLYDQEKNICQVQLITAVPLSKEIENRVVQEIKNKGKMQQVQLESKVDNALIGGFVLEFDNQIIDASIAHKLKMLKKEFLTNEYTHQMK